MDYFTLYHHTGRLLVSQSAKKRHELILPPSVANLGVFSMFHPKAEQSDTTVILLFRTCFLKLDLQSQSNFEFQLLEQPLRESVVRSDRLGLYQYSHDGHQIVLESWQKDQSLRLSRENNLHCWSVQHLKSTQSPSSSQTGKSQGNQEKTPGKKVVRLGLMQDSPTASVSQHQEVDDELNRQQQAIVVQALTDMATKVDYLSEARASLIIKNKGVCHQIEAWVAELKSKSQTKPATISSSKKALQTTEDDSPLEKALNLRQKSGLETQLLRLIKLILSSSQLQDQNTLLL